MKCEEVSDGATPLAVFPVCRGGCGGGMPGAIKAQSYLRPASRPTFPTPPTLRPLTPTRVSRVDSKFLPAGEWWGARFGALLRDKNRNERESLVFYSVFVLRISSSRAYNCQLSNEVDDAMSHIFSKCNDMSSLIKLNSGYTKIMNYSCFFLFFIILISLLFPPPKHSALSLISLKVKTKN